MSSIQNNSSSDGLEMKEIIKKALSYKYLYIACFVLCMIIAYAVNRYSPNVYLVNSIVGPIENQRSGLLGSNELFSGLEAYSQARNLQDDLNTIKSFTLVSSTISKLSLEVGYFIEKGKLFGHEKQITNYAPYIISIDKSHIQPVNTRFYIQILNTETFRLKIEADAAILYNYVDNMVTGTAYSLKLDTICKFNETINNGNFKFSVSLNPELMIESAYKDIHYFEFYKLDNITLKYLNRISVDPVNARSSLIDVQFRGEDPNLTVDFLNSYIQTFLDENLSKKNQIAVNTIKFIDSQISDISDSLLISESQLRDYRSSNQVTDLSYQGQQALTQMTQIETDLSNLQMQERYYEYILDYFNKNQDFAGLAPPSAANVIDPIMNALVLELLELNAQRSAILSNNAEKNLFLGQIENKLKLQKQTIIENVKNNLNTLNLTKNELSYRAERLSREIARLPRTELNMVSMQRKFDLTDAIYTFLLQKRSEAAITMASNYPDFEVLEPARKVDAAIISPRRNVNWLIALFFSLILPTLYIYIRNLLNDKVSSIREIEQISNRKILNTIYRNTHSTEAVVSESPVSSITESFRNLRSSLLMRFGADSMKVILVTSCQPQDGKSFVSFNLATSIAKVGHKTIILDCDLRRPTLHTKFKIDNSTGLSNYMTDNTPRENIIHQTNVENLFFIPAGPALPNTSELFEAGSLDNLLDWLKTKFDHIIIDTTPAGLVSDSSLMMKYASIVLLVARNEFTRKDDLSATINLFQTNKVENFEIVVNDMSIKESRYGRYNNYYTNDPKKKFYEK